MTRNRRSLVRYTFHVEISPAEPHTASCIWPALHAMAAKVCTRRDHAFAHFRAMAYEALSSGALDSAHAHNVMRRIEAMRGGHGCRRHNEGVFVDLYIFRISMSRTD